MAKDPHSKKQKQIRMTDEVRERFDAAQKAAGLTGEDFIVRCLDAVEGRNSTDWPAELRRLANELEKRK